MGRPFLQDWYFSQRTHTEQPCARCCVRVSRQEIYFVDRAKTWQQVGRWQMGALRVWIALMILSPMLCNRQPCNELLHAAEHHTLSFGLNLRLWQASILGPKRGARPPNTPFFSLASCVLAGG